MYLLMPLAFQFLCDTHDWQSSGRLYLAMTGLPGSAPRKPPHLGSVNGSVSSWHVQTQSGLTIVPSGRTQSGL